MVRLADKTHQKSVDAGDARHDAYRDASLLEDRALFDVQLEEAVQALSPARILEGREVGPTICERFAQGSPLRANKIEMRLVKRAGYSPAADTAQPEVVRLLAEKVDDDEVVLEPGSDLAQAPDHLDSSENADDPVETASALDGVGVGTGHDGVRR
jgi:hypothetical protein